MYSKDSGKNKLHMLTLCFTKDQRSILRFLWQRNRDIRNHLKIMKCVYIYLVVFHLQIAAIMLWNELWKIFGPDAARTLRQKSYVDDMLKSYRGVSGAADLIQQIKKICKTAGFSSTKFVSHKIEVMKSIPEKHCRK